MNAPATVSTTNRRAARRAASRPQAQYLITGDENSLSEVEAAVATLPLCAVGRVFIEVPDVEDVSVISTPPRMTVTWLPRSRRSGAPGSGRRCGAGEALTRAATAWADEMFCERSELRPQIMLLGGYLSTADIVDHLVDELHIDPEAIHAPERYGLLAR